MSPPKEITALEQSSAAFECEVLAENTLPVEWQKDGQKLECSAKHEMTSYGTKQSLIVHDVNIEDEGEYSVVVDGERASASLYVEGGY